jgi:hypothetical protein
MPISIERPRRFARLGEQEIELVGAQPRPGERLRGEFSIPPARYASAPLTCRDLSRGWVVVSTLPNIHKRACSTQILGLEEKLLKFERRPRLAHVSADPAEHWREVGHFHPNLRARGYTLDGSDAHSRAAFKAAFGVGVRENKRIAHGLFALHNGAFVAAEIPRDQMTPPPIEGFVHKLAHAME